MNLWRGIVMGASALLAALSAQTADAACTGTCIRLTPAEWACLAIRLERYLGEAGDPILASVLACGPPAETTSTISNRDPDITPNLSSDGKGDADAARKVFFLTKSQLRCLKVKAGSLVVGGGDGLVEFDMSTCTTN